MVANALPRYFVARDGAADQSAARCDEFLPGHAVDTFVVGAPHGPKTEWLVATDMLGNLGAIPAAE